MRDWRDAERERLYFLLAHALRIAARGKPYTEEQLLEGIARVNCLDLGRPAWLEQREWEQFWDTMEALGWDGEKPGPLYGERPR